MQKCCHRLTALTPHPPSQSASVVSDLSFSLSVTTRVESWEYNSLYTPIISIHILDTVLFTFPMVRTKGICFTMKSLFRLGSFPLFSLLNFLVRGDAARRKQTERQVNNQFDPQIEGSKSCHIVREKKSLTNHTRFSLKLSFPSPRECF